MSAEQQNTEQQDLPEDVRQAIEEARAHLAPKYQPFGLTPDVYYVEVCGRHVVLLPWTLQQRQVAMRVGAAAPDSERGLKFGMQLLADAVFWVRGQQEPGKKAACNHLLALAALGGPFAFLIDKLVAEYLGQLDNAGGQAAGKKL